MNKNIVLFDELSFVVILGIRIGIAVMSLRKFVKWKEFGVIMYEIL